ncbi:MBG domain-containing protein [Pontibacter populi]|uniref:MBG domain-containing protein n=1 Tax=Pontibacter populi TaxID=890055 RepID=A0ABV1RY69_9BACT
MDNNGTIDYSTKNTSHTYAAAGIYTAKLTITQDCCTYSTLQQLEVKATPTAPTASSNENVVYGGTLQLQASTIACASYNWTGPDGFTSSEQNPELTNVTLVAAGTYSVTATVNGCPGPAGTVNVTVGKATATLALVEADLDQTYTGTERLVNYTVSPTGLSGVTVTYTGINGTTYAASSIPPTNAGTYAVVASLVNDNYQATDATGTLVVGKAIATVSFSDLAHTYDGTAKAAAVTTNPAGLSGVSVSYQQGTTPVATPTNAGSYTVLTTLTNDNYQLASSSDPATATLVIDKATATITLSDLSHTYDGSAKVASYVTTPAGLSGVTIAYAQGGTPVANPTDAGSYSVTATLVNDNYELAAANDPVIGTLVIDRAIATIMLSDLSHTYDGSAKAATATTSPAGLSGVTVTYKQGTTPVASPTDAGSYAIEATLANDNYQLATSPATATLVINKAIATITLGNLNHTYTGSGKAASYETSPAGLSDVTLAYTQNNVNVASPTDAGNYTVTATLENSNYKLAAGNDPVTGTLVIDKAVASITLSDLNHDFDGTTKAATVATSPTGVSGVSVVYKQGSSLVAAPQDAGSYTVEATLNNSNYKLATDKDPTTATLVINQVKPTLTLAFSNATYNGQPHPATTATITGVGGVELTGTLRYEGVSPTVYASSSTAPTAAGTYKATLAYVGSTNYETLSEEKTYTIAKAVLTVTSADRTKTYGTTLTAVDFSDSFTGMVSGDGITVSRNSTGAVATAWVTTYPIVAVLHDPSNKLSNYDVSNTPGTLTVTQATPTVVATGGTFTYNGQAHAGSGVASGVLSPVDALTPVTLSYEKLTGATYSAMTGAPVDAGTYKVTATFSGNTNYASASHTATITINPALLTVTTNSRSKSYGQVLTSADFSGSLIGNLASDNISIASFSSAGAVGTATIAGGPYQITATLADPNNRLSNYTRQDSYGNLIAQAATLTIKADDKSRAYGDPNPDFTGTVVSGVQNGESFTIAGSAPTALSTSPSGSMHAIIPSVSGSTLANYTVVKQNGTLTITNATLTIKAHDTSRQYSDPNPAFTGFVVSGAQNGESFTVTGTTTATTSSAPSTYTITPAVSGTTLANYTVVKQNGTLTVNRENALAVYTGATFASTASTKSSTATVTMATTILDITADNTDPNYDAFAGDIPNAKVTFVNRDNGTILASNVPVGLVTSGDQKVGTATASVSLSLGGADSESFTIGIIINGYYIRNSSDDNTVVTVSKPLNDFVTGGGYLVLSRSAGEKAGDAGRKNNFGFNIKYNKKGTNLQGKINSIVRRKEADGVVHVYQIKGNVMSSLSVQLLSPSTGKAIFNGQASIQDITNPDLPVSVEGGAMLQVTMTDMGEPGKNDQIAITVWKKDGGLWFASDWDGTQTVEKVLAGGNVVVRGGATGNLNTTSKGKKLDALGATNAQFYNYPNQFSNKTTIAFSLENEESYLLEIYDMRGALIQKVDMGVAEAGKLYEYELDARTLAEGVYIARLVTASKAQSLKMVLKR